MYKASEACVYTVTQVNLLVDWEVCIGQPRNLKSRLFKELNQPIDYTPKYTFKR